MVFLENLYAPLLLAHLFVTFALVGCMTHNLLIVIGYLRGKFGRQKLEWFYVRVSLWMYGIVYLFGALIYPAYRIHMRQDYFEPHLGWANGLFEVKEHWATMGLGMFFVYYLLRRSFQPSEEKDKLYLYVPLCLLLNVIVWYTVFAGCYLTLLKGSWS